MSREDFKIELTVDKEARTLTVSDNGIGMDKEDLENNLGVIASSGSYQFKQEVEDDAKDTDVIGQFGVGFYSAFMVADHITVVTEEVRLRHRLACGSPPAPTATPSPSASRTPWAPTSSCTSRPTPRTRSTASSWSTWRLQELVREVLRLHPLPHPHGGLQDPPEGGQPRRQAGV